jgi:hypothetical protein
MNLTSFNYEKEGKEYIYLVMVEYKDKTLLKVGYTKTLENRMDTYELHNPDFQLLKIREGTRELENYIHKKFEKNKYPKREEWFYYNEEIVEGFNTLEVKNFLDIDKLKNKIINLLKPKSIEELKKIYYERYQEEIVEEDSDKEELDYTITNTFSFINENIENFIDTLDYSEIPLELDPNIHYQLVIPNPISSVDISMDLEQILGRQRLKENPWKNNAKMFVKTTSKKHKMSKEEFDNRLKEKLENSYQLLGSYDQVDSTKKLILARTYQKVAKTFHYKDDYVAVNEHAGNTLVPVLNNLMMVSEMRTFEVQQVDYADRFKVFNAIGERQIEGVGREVEGMFETFSDFAKSKEKLRYLVKVSEMKLSEEDLTNFLSLIPERYREYYTEMGPDRIKANGYQESKLKEEWAKQHQEELGVSDGLILDIAGYFKLGQRYSKSGIKDKLKELYKKHGYQKTAKASDLEEYFWLKTVKFIEGGKWVNGFEIQKKR